MFKTHDPEVLVVGAGPVGLFTALVLAEHGIKVDIVDAQQGPAAHSYALALHSSSLELLSGAGVAGELLARGHRVDKIAFYDYRERQTGLDFSQLPGAYPYVIVLSQRDLEGVLVERLAKRGVGIRWNHRVADLDPGGTQPCVTIDKLTEQSTGYSVATAGRVVAESFQTRPAFIVGADGHGSIVRRKLDIRFDKLREHQFFAVFELGGESDHDHEQRVVLGETADNVLWPMSGGRVRWTFELEESWELVPGTRVKSRLAVPLGEQSFPYLDEDKLKDLVAERAPWYEAAWGSECEIVSDVSWSAAVRFDHRLAERFGRGRIWLAGDAAHLASPVGVHSMNVGLREGHELAVRMAQVLRHNGSAELLERYTLERRSEWRRLLGLDSKLTVEDAAKDWVRKRSSRIPSCVPASGKDLGLLLQQIGLRPHPTSSNWAEK